MENKENKQENVLNKCKRFIVLFAEDSGCYIRNKTVEKKQKRICKKFTDIFITAPGADINNPFWAAVVPFTKKTLKNIKSSVKEENLYMEDTNILTLPDRIMEKAEKICGDTEIDYITIRQKPKPKKKIKEALEDSEFSMQDYIYNTINE